MTSIISIKAAAVNQATHKGYLRFSASLLSRSKRRKLKQWLKIKILILNTISMRNQEEQSRKATSQAFEIFFVDLKSAGTCRLFSLLGSRNEAGTKVLTTQSFYKL